MEAYGNVNDPDDCVFNAGSYTNPAPATEVTVNVTAPFPLTFLTNAATPFDLVVVEPVPDINPDQRPCTVAPDIG